jgi:uncharacterized protein (DUF362 family)
MKQHSISGVTLTFKNHFGSIPDPGALHNHIQIGGGSYSDSQNPLVDIYRNPHIADKTRLIVGDGLFGALGSEDSPPFPWYSFGSQSPNSLFFATDPVAIDCVMYDLLDQEGSNPPGADDYLRIAQGAGLGTFERSASPGVYSQIDYSRIDL